MITEEQTELLVERLIDRIEKANTYFLQRIGSSINRIRELTPSEAQQLVQILKYGGSYDDIIRELSRYTNMNIQDIDKIFSNYAKKDTQFAKQFYEYRNMPYTPFEQNQALMGQINALSNIAKNEMYNFTRSNVLGYSIRDVNGKVRFVGLRETYNRVLDEALLNVGQGKATFDSAMASIMRDIGGSGLKTVDFESGRSMRLDSKVRMDLKARLRELHNELQQQYGREFDSDGIEISVHENPAPDHAPVQGRQFSNVEFDNLQRGLNAKDYKGVTYNLDHDAKNGYRPISEMNCYHYVFSIVLGVSEPEYSDKQLQEIIDKSNEKVKIDGKEYTRYECSQLQRSLERRIREQKDIQTLAKASGNEFLAGESQNKITILTHKYKELSDVSGLPVKAQRLKVSTYKRSASATKTYKSEINKFKVGEFDITEYTDRFKPTTNEVLLTPKQYKHIKDYENRQEAIDLIPDIIKNPDNVYIETKKKNTIWLTKKIDDKKSHKLVIKLNTTSLYQKKELGYKHSIITMHPIKTKTLENYVGKRTIKIDKRNKK